MKINDYVRTDEGIEKILEINYDMFSRPAYRSDKMCEGMYKGLTCLEDFKSSPEITDLLNEGDYVNGAYVLDFETLPTGEKAIVVDSLTTYGWGRGVIPVSEIKLVVTKERFERISYKVGEE